MEDPAKPRHAFSAVPHAVRLHALLQHALPHPDRPLTALRTVPLHGHYGHVCHMRRQRLSLQGTDLCRTLFSARAIHNYFTHKQAVVCRNCEVSGCTGKNPTKYRCMGDCGLDLGHLKFEPKGDDIFLKRKRDPLCCVDCSKAEAARETNLKKKCRSSTVICKCKLVIHNESCPVRGTYMWSDCMDREDSDWPGRRLGK